MTNRNNAKLDCMIYYTLDELVPQDHLVRKMEEALDFRFIYPKVQHLYSRHGRPSIDPVVLFKMLIINIVFGINSMRKTCQEIEVNLAYRWFLGLSIDEKIPNFSTWSQNYIRRYKDSTIFQEIFMEILEQAVDYGFVDFTTVFGDSTHQKANANKDEKIPNFSTWSQNYIRRYKDSTIFEEIFMEILEQAVDYGFVDFTTVFGDSTHQKANANKRKSVKKEVEILKKKYEDDLLVEINEDRECIGKEAFDSMVHTEYVHDEETGEEVKKTSTKTITESTIDPESGCFHKGEKEKCFAYSHQTFCDKNSFVLAVTTVPGNVHDSVSFFDAYEELINGKYGYLIKNVSLDAGYMTPAICRAIVQNDQIPYMPYKRPMTKKGFFKKY
ncbi:transposase, partial [Holdemanella biformis]|uniref:transposase n=1 Tax=Holdemanella biformis TaxID=1735 RepID=UPI003A4E2971